MADVLLTIFGPAVAKAVFNAWCSPEDIGKDAVGSLADLIGASVSDYRARAAARRQFERMAERVADALEPVISAEWASLEAGEREAALFCASEAVGSTAITAKKMVDIRFDPRRLADEIMGKADIVALSADGESLVERVIDEAAQIIVDISENLPGFTSATFAEVLRREDDIRDKVESVIEHFEKIRRQAAKNENAAATRFEESYRRAVARKLDEVELFGVDVSGASRRHNLTAAYIALSVSSKHLVATEEGAPSALIKRSQTGAQRMPQPGALRVEDALAQSPRLLIRGEAGSGKTTLLQYVAVRCATASFAGPLAEWNRLVPFFVRLRAVGQETLPQPEHFPSLVAPNISATMPPSWVHQLLYAGRAVILVDGLDEVSSNFREETKRWLMDLVSEFPACKFIVTSRPTAVGEKWLSSHDFVPAEVLPMSPADIDEFIDHWHIAVHQAEVDVERRADLLTLPSALRARVKQDRALRELAASPLLCAMLCAMHRERRQVLPSNRLSLYEAAISMMVHRRDFERRLSIPDLPSVDSEVKVSVLQEVALWLMENGWAMVDSARARDKISTIIPMYPGLQSAVDADALLGILVMRSGVLRSPIEGKIDFIHKTFQEYLCAKAICRGDKIGFLVNNLDSQQWREVAVLAAGLASDGQRDELLRALLAKGDSDPTKSGVYHLLAVGCLETCVQIDVDIHNEIKKRLVNIKPPKNISEARAISAAGDYALKMLRPYPRQGARSAVACVRALRIINTDGALDVISAYSLDKRVTVLNELVASWPFFERAVYAEKVLSHSSFPGGLWLDTYPQLAGLSHLQQMRNLVLMERGVPHMRSADLAEVAKLTKLKQLSVQCSCPLDLMLLEPMKELISLSVNCPVATGTEVLTQFDLKTLQLDVPDGVPDLGHISHMNDLTYLYLTTAEDLKNEAVFKEFSKLAALSVHSRGSIDADGLLVSRRLQNLTLSSARTSRNLAGLSGFEHLVRLDLRRIDGFTSLDNVPPSNITQLFIQQCGDLSDYRAVSEMTKLQYVFISANRNAVGLEGLAAIPGIRYLNFASIPEGMDISAFARINEDCRIRVPFENFDEFKSVLGEKRVFAG